MAIYANLRVVMSDLHNGRSLSQVSRYYTTWKDNAFPVDERRFPLLMNALGCVFLGYCQAVSTLLRMAFIP